MRVITGDNLTSQPHGTLYQEVFQSGLLGEVRILQAPPNGNLAYVPLLPVLELAIFDPSGLPTIHHPVPQDIPWPEEELQHRSFVIWDAADVERLRQVLAAPAHLSRVIPLELHLELDPATRLWHEAALLSD